MSWVIPYFKKEKSIQKCLKSIYASSFKDNEVIVVFDGEDKEGEKLVSKFKDVKTLTIEHGGAPKARNAGAEIATGDYIVFWDADCYVESGAAAVWLQVFKKYPDVDFVYSGYKFHPDGMGWHDAEVFDPWRLEIQNYISSMFPIKREKAPKWDESLKKFQDWDFWLTAVKNGCKGYYVKGYAFKTDYPDKESISGQCTGEQWLERIETIKNKHGIPLRDTCVVAPLDRQMGIALAKMLDADYMDTPTAWPNRFKTIIQIGFDPSMADVYAMNFRNQWSKSKNILFWRGVDVYTLRAKASRDASDALAILLNGNASLQLCEDIQAQRKLEGMGFNVKVLPLPIEFKDEEIKPIGDFKVLFDVSDDYKDVFDSVKRSMPDIHMEDMSGVKEACDYSVMVHFQNDRSIDANVKRFLLNGRYLISNIQAPYCGYMSTDRNSEETKTAIIKRIRDLQDCRDLNAEAMDYYRKQCSPDKFKACFLELTADKDTVYANA